MWVLDNQGMRLRLCATLPPSSSSSTQASFGEKPFRISLGPSPADNRNAYPPLHIRTPSLERWSPGSLTHTLPPKWVSHKQKQMESGWI